MSNDNLKWMDDLSSRYEWPEPSLRLKDKIMARAHSMPKKAEVKANIFDFVCEILQPKLASAIACTLIIGICFGALTIPKSPAEAYASLYMDSDYFLAQSIVNQQAKRGHDD